MVGYGGVGWPLLAMALCLGGPRLAYAAEGNSNCTAYITSVPAVISSGGTYCLDQDLATAMSSGDAIRINSNHVTIDCNDFRIDGSAAGAGTGTRGIYAADRLNLTVRRCNVRGFLEGISLQRSGPQSNGGRYTVEDSRLDGNTLTGIRIDGPDSLVRRNRVLATGGDFYPSARAGIHAQYRVDIQDNIVSGVETGTGYAVHGILVGFNNGGSISGNRVRGLVGQPCCVGGIWIDADSDRVILRDNDLIHAAGGGTGLFCRDGIHVTRHNRVSGFATAIDGCRDDGGNVIQP